MKYQFTGIIISIALLLVGIIYNITTCLIAGIVFLLCNIGAIIGFRLRKNKKKLLPIVLAIAILATIISLWYIYSMH